MTVRVELNSRESLPASLKLMGGGKVLNCNYLRTLSHLAATAFATLLCCLMSQTAAFAETTDRGSKPDGHSMDVIVLSAGTSAGNLAIGVDSADFSDDSLSKVEKHDTTSFSVFYRVAISKIDRGYHGNAASLDSAAASLRKVVHSRDLRIHKVVIIGAASPEGPKGFNAVLARDRAESVKAFLKGIEPRLTDEDYVIISRGEDWEGATRIAESYEYDGAEGESAVTGIFKGNQGSEEKKRLMKKLDGGRVWHEFITSYYPSLRRSDIFVLYGTAQPIASVNGAIGLLDVPYSNHLAPMTVFPPVEEAAEPRYWSFAVKSNLLYDAVTALNVAVEVPIGKNFSVQYEHVFPWWTAGPNGNKYSMQMLSIGGEARWWFAKRDRDRQAGPAVGADARRDLLLGHYLGLYADGGKFDIQAGRKIGCYQNYFKGAGLSYGYSLPLGRRLNMEFALSVGYMMIDYQHYIPSSDWSVLLKDNGNAGRKHYFGPTKAKVGLVLPIVIKGGKSK